MADPRKLANAAEVLARLAGQAPEQKLLTYDPGPGIYSRLERAVEQMPENVRVQELPGLLKRYKDGVPGWELKETDLDSVIAGRDVVPRAELLARVKDRSPVYTHKEQVRRDSSMASAWADLDDPTGGFMQDAPLGRGGPSGPTKYPEYGQGGKDYTEVLLTQPEAGTRDFHTHWANEHADAAAHARFDTHGDALRINELQSDLGIHNRKVREAAAREEAMGPEAGAHYRNTEGAELPFPLEDAWADILIKRLALEAARKGHRAIEVASPRAIADKVGGNIENYEHFYGKVVPGALERLGRKMGGLVEDAPALRQAETKNVWDESEDLLNQYRRFNQGDPEKIDAFNDLLDATSPAVQRDAASKIYAMFDDGDPGYATAVTRDAIALAEQTNAARAVRERLLRQGIGPPRPPPAAPGRRYLMSDEMRRRILLEGIPASVAGAIGTDQVLDRLDRDSPQPQLR
jgi:hypothetical protein